MTPIQPTPTDPKDLPFEVIAGGSTLGGVEGALALRLGACLNTIRSLQRWFKLIHEAADIEPSLSDRDKIQVYIAMCGCLKETLDVIGGDAKGQALVLQWLALHPQETHELARKLVLLLDGRKRAKEIRDPTTVYAELRRVRNKVDAHWDPEVFATYAEKHVHTEKIRWASGSTSRQADLVINVADEAMQMHLAAGLEGQPAQEYMNQRVRECSESMTLLGFVLEYAIGAFLNTRGAVSQAPAPPANG